MNLSLPRTLLTATSLVVAIACAGCANGPAQIGATGASSGSGATSTGTAGAGGAGTTSSTTTSTGASTGTGVGGGGTVGPHGPGATETVNAGGVVKSAKYEMVFTFGQPTQNQAKSESKGYTMQGGLVGANGTLP